MSRRNSVRSALRGILLVGLAASQATQVRAQQPPVPGAARPAPPRRSPLFFREEWRQPPTPGERPATQEAVGNANLQLQLYGASAKDILLSGNADNEAGPLNLWTGVTTSPIAATLRERENYVDLTGLGKIRWVTRTSGFHAVRPIVKLADGTWLVGDAASGTWGDFNESEISFADVHWIKLNIERVVTNGKWVDNPDLSKVDEIGFVDLMPGSGHGPGGWVNVSRIEVHGKPIKR